MRKTLTYTGIFIVAVVVMQLLVFDSLHLWLYFAPPVYIAFIVLLPINTKPFTMLALGLVTGMFMDFFEGTAGLYTAVTMFTAFTRRGVMMVMLGREVVEEEEWMPSFWSLGKWKFARYSAAVVLLHSLVFFSLEALTRSNYGFVLLKTLVSGTVTLVAVWAVAMLFTNKTMRRA